MSQEPTITFHVTSNFGQKTQKPFVMVAVNGPQDFMTQMSPAEARDLALNLLTAADASESDAFLITFLRRKVKANDQAIVGILQDFRQWREDAAKEGGPA
jgi:hypothetical protein